MQKHVQMKCLWSKVSGIQCILSDLNIRLEQPEKENPAYKNWFKVARYDFVYSLFGN